MASADEVCIVIGASRGLGAALATELARRDPGCPVLATVRGDASGGGSAPAPTTTTTPPMMAKATPPETTTPVPLPPNIVVVPGIDISTDACIPALRAALGRRLIRTLIISAAAMTKDEGVRALGSGDSAAASSFMAGVSSQFATNALGPIRVAAALAGSIRPGGKLILVASRTGLPSRIRAAGTGGMVGYRTSKSAALAIGLILAADLAPQGVAVGSIHPGTILTSMYAAWHGLPPGGAPGGGGAEERRAVAAGASAAAAGGAEERKAVAAGGSAAAALGAAAAVIAPRTHTPVSPEAAASRFLNVVEARVCLEASGRVWDEEGVEMEY